MQIPFVDLKAQYNNIKHEIREAIDRVLSETTFIGGKPLKDFETNFASHCDIKHVIGVGNGTDAIYVVLKMLGIGPGDEVITAANSWISTSETISQTGAKPVFVDVDPETFTIDPNLIEGKITPKTKAVIPVHLYGQMAHISQIAELCKKYKLYLVEDCAQSHFSSENGVLAGKTGVAGTFSFYPGKNLGAYGDAGCIITNDDYLERKFRMYANHGALIKHEHQMEGINSRLDTVQAAILNVKLKHISDWNRKRIHNAGLYREQLDKLKFIKSPTVRRNTIHTFHLYVIQAPERDRLKKHLEAKGIHTAIHYPTALPNLPAYQYLGHAQSDFPIASRLQNEVLSLPMYPELETGQINYVCEKISEFYK
jgi:dTDP-4-amino-4,6-dideoxygalactose transaminase